MEFRVAQAEDMPAINRLADQVFRRSRPGQHMQAEFPYLYDPRNASHWYVATEANQMVGIVGAMVWRAIISGANTCVASLGSVATDPAFRSQHVASHLLELAENRLRAEGVRLVLVSGDRSLYWRFGARPIGWVTWHRLRPASRSHSHYRSESLDPIADAERVARLYQTRSTRFSRTLAQLTAMLTVQPLTQVEQGTKLAQVIYAAEATEPSAYVIVNHGPQQGKEPSRLLEWAGDPAAVLEALRRLNGDVLVPALPEEYALRALLRDDPVVSAGPVSWVAKVIDGPGLGWDLDWVLSELHESALSIESVGDGAVSVIFQGQSFSTDAAGLTEWMFGWGDTRRPTGLGAVWPLPALWPEGLNYI